MSQALGNFYKDLTDPDFSSNFCVYHRRFRCVAAPFVLLALPLISLFSLIFSLFRYISRGTDSSCKGVGERDPTACPDGLEGVLFHQFRLPSGKTFKGASKDSAPVNAKRPIDGIFSYGVQYNHLPK